MASSSFSGNRKNRKMPNEINGGEEKRARQLRKSRRGVLYSYDTSMSCFSRKMTVRPQYIYTCRSTRGASSSSILAVAVNSRRGLYIVHPICRWAISPEIRLSSGSFATFSAPSTLSCNLGLLELLVPLKRG